MIILSEKFKEWVGGFPTQTEAADFLGISRQWLNGLLSGKPVSADLIQTVKEKTGWDFEKAFEVKEDKDG